MLAKVQRWGNSLAIRIPRSFAIEAGFENDSMVNMQLEEGKLIVETARLPSYVLEDLLAQVTDENVHEEYDWGKPVGKEVW